MARREKEELISRLRGEVRDELSALRRERDEMERRLEGASMAREEEASVARASAERASRERNVLAGRLEAMEGDLVELATEREQEKLEGVALMRTAKQDAEKARREKERVEGWLAEAARERKEVEGRYEEAMVEVERQANALKSMRAEQTSADARMKQVLAEARASEQEKQGAEAAAKDLHAQLASHRAELALTKARVIGEGNIMLKVKEQYEAEWQARLKGVEREAEEREAGLRAQIQKEWNLMEKVKEKVDLGWQVGGIEPPPSRPRGRAPGHDYNFLK